MKTFYFSSTGNCLATAKCIGGEIISIPQVLRSSKRDFSDDVIGIVFPCYCLIAPRIVREFIEKVSLKADYIYAVMTYGNFSGNGVHWFSKFAARHGIDIDYGQELLMIDNYLPMFDMKKQKAADKKTDEYLGYIVSDIQRKRKYINRKNMVLRGISAFMPLMYDKIITGGYKNFRVDDRCTACGVCGRVCPKDNIAMNQKPKFGSNCELCLGCVHLCPVKAITIIGEKNPEERFIHHSITVKELIESNGEADEK